MHARMNYAHPRASITAFSAAVTDYSRNITRETPTKTPPDPPCSRGSGRWRPTCCARTGRREQSGGRGCTRPFACARSTRCKISRRCRQQQQQRASRARLEPDPSDQHPVPLQSVTFLRCRNRLRAHHRPYLEDLRVCAAGCAGGPST